MRQVAHLLRADLRRHRWLLAAWVAVVAGSALFQAVKPTLDLQGRLQAPVDLLGGLLWLTRALLGALIVALVIQTHSLVGTTPFWMTRPIRPGALLASKAALLVTALAILPLLASAAVMAAYHVPVGPMLGVLTQDGLEACLWLVVLAAVAAVTPTLARFALVIGGLLLGLVGALVVVTAMLASRDDFEMYALAQEASDPAAGLALNVLLIASGLVLLVMQYRTRVRVRAVAVGLACAGVSVLAIEGWPWSLLTPPAEVPSWAASASRPRLVAGEGAPSVPDHAAGRAGRRWRQARAPLYLDGVPAGWTVQARLLESRLSVPGGGELVTSPRDALMSPAVNTLPLDSGRDNAVRRATRHVLEVERLADGGPPRGESALVLSVPEDEYRRVAPAVGHYRGRFEIVATRHLVEGRLPLRVGAWHQHGAHRVVIDAIDMVPGGVIIALRRSDAWSAFDRRQRNWPLYYLRNRADGAAMGGWAYEYGAGAVGLGALHFGTAGAGGTGGFFAQRVSVSFPPANAVLHGDPVPIDAGWLAGAELVIVNTEVAAPVERRIEIDPFTLGLPEKP